MVVLTNPLRWYGLIRAFAPPLSLDLANDATIDSHNLTSVETTI